MASSPRGEPPGWARAVGALLLTADDPWIAADLIREHLLSPNLATKQALEAARVPVQLVEDFRAMLPAIAEDLTEACRLGAAWESGRRSVPSVGQWSPVATWIGGADGFAHQTAESLISLIIGARSRIRLFAPFVDEAGLRVIAFALAAATQRRVRVDVAYREATAGLFETVVSEAVATKGLPENLRLLPLLAGDNFPHLKVLTVDGVAAYVGSANLTWAALVHNVELGVLVDGPSVAALEHLFDQLVKPPTSADEDDQT